MAAFFETFPPVETSHQQTQGSDVNDFSYVENVSNFSATTDSWEAEFNDQSGEVDPIAYWEPLLESPLRIAAIQIPNVPASTSLWNGTFSL